MKQMERRTFRSGGAAAPEGAALQVSGLQRTNAVVTTARFDASLSETTVTVSLADPAAAVVRVMNTGTVPYRVAGNIRVSSAVGSVTVPYDRTGRFSPLGGNSR